MISSLYCRHACCRKQIQSWEKNLPIRFASGILPRNGKVKKRSIAILSHCTAEEIAAIKLALKNKGDLGALESIKEGVELKEGRSVGAV